MGLALVLILSFGLLLIGAPLGLAAANHPLGAGTSSIMIGFGIVLVIVCATLLTITKLYQKTRASEAFVRTGMGGMHIIRDGGSIVIPVVHQIVRVSLETIRLDVQRTAVDALITADKLRADIKAEFFVRVQPDDESISAAARSLGDKMTEETVSRRSGVDVQGGVARLIEDKLVSALRTAAARKTLEQLNSERDEFLKEVTDLVKGDLKHNGFTLETVTISKLDQTDETNLKTGNTFDAQGMKTTAEIVQKNLTEKNQIMRAGEQARAAQDVETRKKILELERAQAQAEAEQAAQIAQIKAEQTRISREKEIEANLLVEKAQVEQAKQIEVAKRQQQQAIEIAERGKEQAITEAEQKVEVAKRDQQKAVAVAEAEKAHAEAKLADAEAERMKARQQIITVETVATAKRDGEKAVITAQAEADKQYVGAQKTADANAYKIKTEADARKASADADAEATRKKADAEAFAVKSKADGDKHRLLAEADGQKAKLLADAEGQQALAMVPINVKGREVEIDKQRVEDVLKPELKARAEDGKVAQDFELAKFRIEKEAEVRIATANAMATVHAKVTANVYGTPEDVAKMTQHFANGMGIAQMAGGFLSGAGPETLDVARRALTAAEELVAAGAEKLKAKPEKNEANGSVS